MSGFADVPGSEIRAKLDYPIIDADAHIVECDFAVADFIREIGGKRLLDRHLNYPLNPLVRTRSIWWGTPSGEHSSDQAMALLPKYFASRMEECGIDFAHMLTTLGLGTLYTADDELRVVRARAINTMYAEIFRDVGDRVRPVAVIPTYNPAEAIRELEYAVLKLGHKAIMIGTEVRGTHDEVMREAPHLAPYAAHRRSIVMDAEHDFDPFWRRCVEFGVAPICHTSSRGYGYRHSPSNYVFNHIGDFAGGAEFFCRSLFFSGVTKRFPTLNFAFLEGGAAWALILLNAIVEHWEKRNVEALERDLDPSKLDIEKLAVLFAMHGDSHLTEARFRERPHNFISKPGKPELFDEFGASGMVEIQDLVALFCEPFYFGCEADDRMTAVAFNRKLNPVGKKLKAMFGSDIGHWDVMDARSIVSEAYSLVDADLITLADFRELMFVNPAMLHLGMNPDYFAGTVVEEAVKPLVKSIRRPTAV